MKESLFNMLGHNFREIIAVSVIYTVSFINCFIKKKRLRKLLQLYCHLLYFIIDLVKPSVYFIFLSRYIENVLEDILREHSWTMQTYQVHLKGSYNSQRNLSNFVWVLEIVTVASKIINFLCGSLKIDKCISVSEINEKIDRIYSSSN